MIRQMNESAPPGDNHTVLVAMDGSEDSRRILERVAALPTIHDNEVIVFHVHQKAYSGVATLDVGPPPVISAQDAAADLVRGGIRARAVEKDGHLGEPCQCHSGSRRALFR